MDQEDYDVRHQSRLTLSDRHVFSSRPGHFALQRFKKTNDVTERKDRSPPEHRLRYSVKSYSSYSQTYKPCNVLENKPSDQASRWSADGNHLPQYLTLKLDKTSIVSSITFGKYEKSHVCNLKRFQVLGGLNEDHMSELFLGGLTNNHIPETFQLRHTSHGHIFPCNFIKIVPLLSWEQGFNCSIWHIQLHGHDEDTIVQPVLKSFTDFRERQAMRLCLKHLRQHGYVDEFEGLQKKTCVQLEDPQLTELYKLLVVSSDFLAAEKILIESARGGLFADYVSKQSARAEWRALKPSCSGRCMWPGIRGGHQMLVDPETQILYLFGGWDGLKDLADLWCYDIQARQWECLCTNTERQGGPSARSCHKMCIDYVNKKIYTLGRFVDLKLRRTSTDNLKNDFYCYDIMSNTWTQLSDDTAVNGGPQLVYDHQMCMDIKNQTIYVFGGRIWNSERDDFSHSTPRFFVYHCLSNTWKQLYTTIPPHFGHTMVFHETFRKLYILGGQGEDISKYFTDIYIYDVDADTVAIVRESDQTDIPRDGYMQRATIDSDLSEIYIFKGQNRKESEGQLSNSFWIYNIETCNWACLYKSSSDQRLLPNPPEPCPRFAHQLAYDHTKKVHYLFAGNQGQTRDHKMRLDDFWILKLKRVHVNDILHICQHMVRKQRFTELSRCDPLEALTYLQRDLAEVVNHDDPVEREEFQSLVSVLFKQSPQLADGEASSVQGVASADIYSERVQLFDRLTVYFPLAMTQPKEDLVDLIGF